MTDDTAFDGFAAALARAPDADAAFALLEQRSAAMAGHILFTCLRFDRKDGVMSRLYSNREDVSPTGGSKPIPHSAWADRLLRDGNAYIGYDKADLKDVFFDHEQLWAIGCESVMNVPVLWQGVVVGSYNILGGPGQYSEETARAFAPYAQLAVPLLLQPKDLEAA
ncbi:GAF domain-containing protein [Azorhizobium oxalatiphilum]|uniref:GAF domain-containing protein n=1 Tax=Azorhizobium oxalatiphilum TaxID=980631 RepID=A0A917F5K4_9HYPH|nr:GAF domain-containing protein [Azorhizobium oxalatiphilum]GGF50304.1 GAF domain-containing protein [Azorhizobium oxalatiphilum]